MLLLETMPVKLDGRSPPAHNAARMVYLTDLGPCGYQGIQISRVPYEVMVFKGLNV